MFKVVVCGGIYDGEPVCITGSVSQGKEPVYRFEDYADAQEFIENAQEALAQGDFGEGAALGIDYADGDVTERY